MHKKHIDEPNAPATAPAPASGPEPSATDLLIERHQRRHGAFDPSALDELRFLLDENPDTARILYLLESVKG